MGPFFALAPVNSMVWSRVSPLVLSTVRRSMTRYCALVSSRVTKAAVVMQCVMPGIIGIAPLHDHDTALREALNQSRMDSFRASLREPLSVLRNPPRKSQTGCQPHDLVLMFKILLLQQPNRHWFCSFSGRDLEDKAPDARTIWLFRVQLTRHERHNTWFKRFEQQWVSQEHVIIMLGIETG